VHWPIKFSVVKLMNEWRPLFECITKRNDRRKLVGSLFGCQTTRPADNSDTCEDKSARKRELVGQYVKTTRTFYVLSLIKINIIYYCALANQIFRCKANEWMTSCRLMWPSNIIVGFFTEPISYNFTRKWGLLTVQH
jgi:hypothetical protein